MHSIPIVVSRLTASGQKQVYTLKDTMDDLPDLCQPSHPITGDSQNQKQNKVRIRRIQSSGSKRKFPRDFFSRESNRGSKNSTLKQKQFVGLIKQETASFATINDPPLNTVPLDHNLIETPKFQSKPNTQRILYKNQTLKQAIRKYSKKKENQLKEPEINNRIKPVLPFENTFAGEEFRHIKEHCLELQLNTIFKKEKDSSRDSCLPKEKENIPLKKIKATKESLLKKFSLIKEKQRNLKNKNIQ